MSFEDIVVPMPQKRKKPYATKIKRAMKMPPYKMLTIGQQIRMVREMRRLTIDQVSRITGLSVTTIAKMEKWDGYNSSIDSVNVVLKALGATMVVMPVSVPSFINTHEEAVIFRVVKVRSRSKNSAIDEQQ